MSGKKRESTRDAVETAIEQSKQDRNATWEQLGHHQQERRCERPARRHPSGPHPVAIPAAHR